MSVVSVMTVMYVVSLRTLVNCYVHDGHNDFDFCVILNVLGDWDVRERLDDCDVCGVHNYLEVCNVHDIHDIHVVMFMMALMTEMSFGVHNGFDDYGDVRSEIRNKLDF